MAGRLPSGRWSLGRHAVAYLPTNPEPAGGGPGISPTSVVGQVVADPSRVQDGRISTVAIAPTRRMVGPSPDTSTTVEADPPSDGPPSRIELDPIAERPPDLLGIPATGPPERLADVVGSGPRARASVRGASWSGTRRPIVDRPPVRTSGSVTSERCAQHEGQAARPERRGERVGRRGHHPEVASLRHVGEQQHDPLVRGPPLDARTGARCLRASRARPPDRRPCPSGWRPRRPPRRASIGGVPP